MLRLLWYYTINASVPKLQVLQTAFGSLSYPQMGMPSLLRKISSGWKIPWTPQSLHTPQYKFEA